MSLWTLYVIVGAVFMLGAMVCLGTVIADNLTTSADDDLDYLKVGIVSVVTGVIWPFILVAGLLYGGTRLGGKLGLVILRWYRRDPLR